MIRLALYQPDIAPNVGTILRTGACLNVPVDIIEPCGFPFSDRALRRAGMDYVDIAEYRRHSDWNCFNEARLEDGRRLVLLTTHARQSYTALTYRNDDTLLLGQESAGVPREVHNCADERALIPMARGTRSLNIAIAASIVLGEALRQTSGYPTISATEESGAS